MKITKKLMAIFTLTFFTGLLSYFLFMKFARHNETVVSATVLKEIPAQPNVIEDLPEILDENNDWKDDDRSNFKIKLLETGEGFHGNQILAKTGEKWLGLFKGKDGFYLKETKLQIARVNDPVVDDLNAKTGKSVRTIDKNFYSFLLKNAYFLKQGEIQTLFGSNPNDIELEEGIDYLPLTVGLYKEFNFGDEKRTLRVKRGVTKKGENIIALILESGGVKQTLHSYQYYVGDDNIGTLDWAGDLDQDGKADFYLSLFIGENFSYKALFLSSKAEKNKLVKKVAVFSTSGC